MSLANEGPHVPDDDDGLSFPDFGEGTFLAEGEEGDDGDDGGLELDAAQQEEIRRIFLTTLPQYLEPVEQMVDQLFAAGQSSAPETFEALSATLKSLGEASARMGFDDVCQSLDRMGHRLSVHKSESEPEPTELREQLLDDLQVIREITDEVAGGGSTAASPADELGETIVAALGDASGIDRSVLGRLTTAGLVRVDQLLTARPDEIVAVTGLSEEVVDGLLVALSPERRTADVATAEPAVAKEARLESQLSAILAAQADAEASIDGLHKRVQHLRASVAALHDELGEAAEGNNDRTCELARAHSRFGPTAAKLANLRVVNEGLVHQLLDDDKTLKLKERQIAVLKADCNGLAKEQSQFDGDVAALVERVENMLEIAKEE